MKLKVINKPIIVVLGIHRSSTSLTARAPQLIGADLEEHLIPPIDGDNDKGFWEDTDINVFDNTLLEKVGSSWDRLKLLGESVQTHNQSVSK